VIISFDWFVSIFWLVLLSFVLSSTLGLLIAGKYVNILRVLDGLSIRALYTGVFLLLLFALYFVGSQTNSSIEFLIITLFLLPVGFILRNFDTSPLLYGFFLHDTIFYTIDTFSVLYNLRF